MLQKLSKILLLTFVGWNLGLGTITLKFAFGAEPMPISRVQSHTEEVSYWAQYSPQDLNLIQKIYTLRKGEDHG